MKKIPIHILGNVNAFVKNLWYQYICIFILNFNSISQAKYLQQEVNLLPYLVCCKKKCVKSTCIDIKTCPVRED